MKESLSQRSLHFPIREGIGDIRKIEVDTADPDGFLNTAQRLKNNLNGKEREKSIFVCRTKQGVTRGTSRYIVTSNVLCIVTRFILAVTFLHRFFVVVLVARKFMQHAALHEPSAVQVVPF